jgi:hypothetical protein
MRERRGRGGLAERLRLGSRTRAKEGAETKSKNTYLEGERRGKIAPAKTPNDRLRVISTAVYQDACRISYALGRVPHWGLKNLHAGALRPYKRRYADTTARSCATAPCRNSLASQSVRDSSPHLLNPPELFAQATNQAWRTFVETLDMLYFLCLA